MTPVDLDGDEESRPQESLVLTTIALVSASSILGLPSSGNRVTLVHLPLHLVECNRRSFESRSWWDSKLSDLLVEHLDHEKAPRPSGASSSSYHPPLERTREEESDLWNYQLVHDLVKSILLRAN